METCKTGPISVTSDFIINCLKPKYRETQYFKGIKRKQQKDINLVHQSQRKPGPKQKLGLGDDLLLVLMCIHLDFSIEDLVFLFLF